MRFSQYFLFTPRASFDIGVLTNQCCLLVTAGSLLLSAYLTTLMKSAKINMKTNELAINKQPYEVNVSSGFCFPLIPFNVATFQ